MPVFLVTVSDVLWGLVVLGGVLAALVVYFKEWRGQERCRHEQGVRETQSCDAICKQCGENLGFIGQWRKKHGIGSEE
jgi:hypothetical protein